MTANTALRIADGLATRYDGTRASGSISPRWTVHSRTEHVAPHCRGGKIVGLCEKRWTAIHAMLLDVRSNGSIEVDLGAPAPRLTMIVEAVEGASKWQLGQMRAA